MFRGRKSAKLKKNEKKFKNDVNILIESMYIYAKKTEHVSILDIEKVGFKLHT